MAPMKKILTVILFAATVIACKKTQTNTAPPVRSNKIAGKWTISSVTVIPRDSTGKALNSGTIYAEPSYYYFQFNTDNSWVQNLAPDPNSGIGESGAYILHADTGFTLINVNLPSSPEECKIATLNDSELVFSHQKATLFNGVTPGYLEYLFDLKK
jgi:hypothetical protein